MFLFLALTYVALLGWCKNLREKCGLFPDDLTCHFDYDLAGPTADQHPFRPVKDEQTAGERAHRTVITGPWPDFPSQDHKLFKSVQVTHQRESEYKGGRIKQEC